MLNIPRMKLALPEWIWPDVQRLITSASSVVFKRVLAEKLYVCVSVCAGEGFTPHKAASVSFLAKYL